jgi:hypothetical protein
VVAAAWNVFEPKPKLNRKFVRLLNKTGCPIYVALVELLVRTRGHSFEVAKRRAKKLYRLSRVRKAASDEL